MLPLTYVKSGDFVKILKVNGKDDARKHLNDLGFVEGTVCAVISSHSGDVILNVKDSRLAVTREMADRIMIDIVDKIDYSKSLNEISK
ncbi:MAG: ferrous iron transport protein A [Lachnospiraceae bacterium]|nr:ferrous iron transport protein A [Lachnospiraceae bacterium]